MSEQKVAFFIDDDPNFLEVLPDVVRHPHFKIQTYCATNGYRTIDEVIKARPDVLFIDFYLPRASSGQILPILKSVHGLANLPVYILTGYTKEEILPFLEETDCKGILLKDDTLPVEILRIFNQIDHGTSANGGGS